MGNLFTSSDSLFQLGFIILFGWGVAHSGLALYRAVRSNRWAKTEGILIEKHTVEDRDLDGTITKHQEILYEYTVGRKAYQNDKYRAGIDIQFTFGASDSSAQRRLIGYLIGDPIDVFYNPRNPKESCLKQGGVVNSIVAAAICLIFYFIALIPG